jgi:hypothetical protein
MGRTFAPALVSILLVGMLGTALARADGAATPGSAYVGWYALPHAGDDPPQPLTLRLRADGIASLRGMGVFETGTWREDDKGHATVHLDMTSRIAGGIPTNQQRESVDLTFTLAGCMLKVSDDPGHRFGAGGLTLAKQACTTS